MADLQKKLNSKYSFIKTHSIYYSELIMLYKMSKDYIKKTSLDDEGETENNQND